MQSITRTTQCMKGKEGIHTSIVTHASCDNKECAYIYAKVPFYHRLEHITKGKPPTSMEYLQIINRCYLFFHKVLTRQTVRNGIVVLWKLSMFNVCGSITPCHSVLFRICPCKLVITVTALIVKLKIPCRHFHMTCT